MNPSNKKPESEEEKAAMTVPYTPKRCPKNMKLVPGKEYLYCACGLTNDPPFCDNSHEGTPFKPIPFVAKNQIYSSICLCRRASTTSLPYCDGTHSHLQF